MSSFSGASNQIDAADAELTKRLSQRRRFLKVSAGLAVTAIPIGIGVKGVLWVIDKVDRAH
jgi:hypothetical protein